MEWESFFEDMMRFHKDPKDLLRSLMKSEMPIAIYSAMQFVGNPEVLVLYNFQPMSKEDFQLAMKKLHLKTNLPFDSWVRFTYYNQRSPFGNKVKKTMAELSYQDFENFVHYYKERNEEVLRKRRESKRVTKEKPLYMQYEYGMSDW